MKNVVCMKRWTREKKEEYGELTPNDRYVEGRKEEKVRQEVKKKKYHRPVQKVKRCHIIILWARREKEREVMYMLYNLKVLFFQFQQAERRQRSRNHCTRVPKRKGKQWSLAECQALANEGRTRAQSRALGSWAGFYWAFLGARAHAFLPPAILVWLEWSEAPCELIVATLGGWVDGWRGLRGRESTKEMLVPCGIRLQGRGSPSPASFTGCIPRARLIQSTSVAVVLTTQPWALLLLLFWTLFTPMFSFS